MMRVILILKGGLFYLWLNDETIEYDVKLSKNYRNHLRIIYVSIIHKLGMRVKHLLNEKA